MLSFASRRPLALLAALAFAACVLLGGVAWACKTPVYRYAMYRWEPAPYEVYFFHDADLPPSDQAVHDAFAKLLADPENAPNLSFQAIDLRKDAKLEGLPRDVRDLFLAKRPKLPAYLILSPEGNEIHRGPLTAADVEALVDSPARRELAAHLADAKAGVFLVLTGGGKNEVQAAEELCKKLIEQVRTGELQLYDPEIDAGGAAADKKPTPADALKQSPPLPAIVVIRRDDPREAWLVRQLLAVESDLATLPGPMIFPAFGRGRVLPPYLGKGITRENLTEGLHYVTGACACTVKEQNPGHELLMRHPWHEVAEAMAKRFQAEEGSGLAFRDLQIFPEGEPVKPAAPAEKATQTSEPPPATPSKVVEPPLTVATSSDGHSGHAKVAPAATASDDASGAMLRYLGVGIAAVVILLAAATWAIRNPAA